MQEARSLLAGAGCMLLLYRIHLSKFPNPFFSVLWVFKSFFISLTARTRVSSWAAPSLPGRVDLHSCLVELSRARPARLHRSALRMAYGPSIPPDRALIKLYDRSCIWSVLASSEHPRYIWLRQVTRVRQQGTTLPAAHRRGSRQHFHTPGLQ